MHERDRLTNILFGALDSRAPGLTLNLSSNNPFRNRAVSPSFPSGQTSPFDAPPRPLSRNPFLDASSINSFPAPPRSPDEMSFATDATAAPRSALTGHAAELFVRDFQLGMQMLHPFKAETTNPINKPPDQRLYLEESSTDLPCRTTSR
jgi:hypothetical protein